MKPAFECDGKVCRISGAATFSSLDDLSVDLLARAGRQQDLKLDLLQMSDCDSAFAALLMACLQIKKQQNHTLELLNSPQQLLSLFEVYGLTESGLQIS
ncbi:MAG: STAS domain-containing protein [Pseudomonadota bacterium]|nr:STAS domain-containing protein [Pseudomonadota bacterium]